MTTDHELLGVIADMRKRAEANDKLYLFELEDFADRLQSLLGGGWQDISTAPKDGNRILLCLNKTGPVVIGRWNEKEAAAPCLPTHWQPLPSAPETPK